MTMFIRKSLLDKQAKPRMAILKYMTMFFLGASAVLLTTQALEIQTNLTNSIQYIRQIILTSDGGNTATTGIVLDGSGGNAFFMGKVGIGTSTPQYNLDIRNDTGAAAIAVTGGASMLALNGDSTYSSGLGLFHGANSSLSFSYLWSLDSPLYLSAGASLAQGITITTGGNIGIGTATPDSQLEIAKYGAKVKIFNELALSTPYAQIQLNGDPLSLTGLHITHMSGGSASIGNRDGQLGLYAGNGANGITVTTGGNVGIGIITPSYKLHVVGDTYVSGSGLFMGNVGIGTSSPDQKLHVSQDGGNLLFRGRDLGGDITSTLSIGPNYESGFRFESKYFNGGSSAPVRFINGNYVPIYISADGTFSPTLYISTGINVGIGTSSPEGKLDVIGPSDTRFTMTGSSDAANLILRASPLLTGLIIKQTPLHGNGYLNNPDGTLSLGAGAYNDVFEIKTDGGVRLNTYSIDISAGDTCVQQQAGILIFSNDRLMYCALFTGSTYLWFMINASTHDKGIGWRY